MRPSFPRFTRQMLACPEGIEPPTTCLEGRCSIQLSYGQQNSRACDGGQAAQYIFRVDFSGAADHRNDSASP